MKKRLSMMLAVFFLASLIPLSGQFIKDKLKKETTVSKGTTGDVYLGDLEPVRSEVGKGTLERNVFAGNLPIKLGGKTYGKGLSTHAWAKVTYKLEGSYKQFESVIGLWDSGNANRTISGETTYQQGKLTKETVKRQGSLTGDALKRQGNIATEVGKPQVTGTGEVLGQRGSVVFQVFLDGKLAFDSGLMRWSDTKTVSIPVAGAGQITLEVTHGGDGNDGDYAVWGDAKFKTK